MSFEESTRGIARTYLRPLLDRGYSGRKTLKWLRGQNLGYRTKNFYADWREFKERKAKMTTVRYISKQHKPTYRTITQTSENLRDQYSYVFEVRGRDSLTGEKKTIDWRHATEDLLSMEEAESEVASNIREAEYQTRITDVHIVATEVLSRPRL